MIDHKENIIHAGQMPWIDSELVEDSSSSVWREEISHQSWILISQRQMVSKIARILREEIGMS